MNCPNCGVPLMGGMVICPKCKYDTRTKDGGESFRQHKNKIQADKEREAKEAYKNENRAKLREEMIMSTCHSIENYRVKRHCGLVFGEIVFKTNYFKTLGAGFENMLDKFVANVTFDDAELSGTTRMISNARKYAITRMKDEAIERDANAIVGIQVESSVGGEYLHITMTGTAVELESQSV